MLDDLKFHLKALTRLIYVQTDEEDRFLINMTRICKDSDRARVFVFNAAMGLHPIETVIDDWKQHQHPQSPRGKDQNELFLEIYKDIPPKREKRPEFTRVHIYVITDPDRWLPDLHIQRRLLNCVHSINNHEGLVKILIFVGARRVIPEKLAKYMEVLVDPGPTQEEVEDAVGNFYQSVKLEEYPENMYEIFKGLTLWEIKAALGQMSYRDILNKRTPKIDPLFIRDYRKKALKKTDLISYVDTSNSSFAGIGGLQRFKDWVQKTKAAWTPEGQAFGLVPPKGILSVGVWGCGKSASVKAMGNAWGLPVVALEMGKLKTAAQGGSENNLYTALRLVESVSPCILFVDEGEKSLGGGESSAVTDGGTTSRMIGIFSTWLQETTAQVTLAITANSLKTLPIEFVNRLDERFFFDMPSSKERIEIIKIHLAKLGRKKLSETADLARLGQVSEGMVGREIEQAVKAALRESFDQKLPDLDLKILENELRLKPRISKTMADDIKALTEWVGFDPESNDGIRAKFASTPKQIDTNNGMKLL